MTISEKMSGSLQENIITLMAHSDEHGRLVANNIDPQLFEGELRVMAERIGDYWRQHDEAPKLHTSDLFADILEDPRNRRAPTYRRTLVAMLQLAQNINAKYVVSQLKTFSRTQMLKDAILRSAEILNRAGDTSEVDNILSDILRARDFMLEPGLRFDQYEIALDYLKAHRSEFSTGISLFDRAGVVPARGTLFLLLGGSGLGKSWAMVHIAKLTMLLQKHVLYVTPELSAEDVLLRSYMAMFAASSGQERIRRSVLFREQDGRFTGFAREAVEAEFDLHGKSSAEELQAHIAQFGERLGELRIYRVAPRSLSVNGLIGYLDGLEATEGFVPDMLIVDSAYLLKLDGSQKEYRHALGQAYEKLRGIGVERNIAVVASHQLSKEGFKARRANIVHVAEDWSIIQTADVAVTLSATKAEHDLGLGRLYADKTRASRGSVNVAITQNLDIGQFCLDSIRPPALPLPPLFPAHAGEGSSRSARQCCFVHGALHQLFEALVRALRQALAKGCVAFLQDADIRAVLIDFFIQGIIREAHSRQDRLFAHAD